VPPWLGAQSINIRTIRYGLEILKKTEYLQHPVVPLGLEPVGAYGIVKEPAKSRGSSAHNLRIHDDYGEELLSDLAVWAVQTALTLKLLR